MIFLSHGHVISKARSHWKFASSPIFHHPSVGLTHPWVPYPWLLICFFVVMWHLKHVETRRRILKTSQLPPEVRASRWACINLPRVWLFLAQLRDFRMPMRWEWHLIIYDCHGAPNQHREAMTPERMDYRKAWWCMAIRHPHLRLSAKKQIYSRYVYIYMCVCRHTLYTYRFSLNKWGQGMVLIK